MREQPENAIILFDGICNFCNGAVQFIINRDRRGYFRFASLQSEAGQKLIAGHPRLHNLDSIILIENGSAYSESTAIMRIAKHLDGPWKAARTFLLVPSILRDPLYRYIARHRYRWFGKREACMIPTPEIRQRFLD
ncbi:MAG: thiol-disulfide oxidoreductase family protein [Paenibacillaceae bacterium]|jgi:predicted DCC family thiol-disulfide oxidoreductase YuxK|nr:thiol-disulfide oxidoreductase family protein [Paenibacillaceae bacterium]